MIGIHLVTFIVVWFSVTKETDSQENKLDKKNYGIRMLRMGKKNDNRFARSISGYDLNDESFPKAGYENFKEFVEKKNLRDLYDNLLNNLDTQESQIDPSESNGDLDQLAYPQSNFNDIELNPESLDNSFGDNISDLDSKRAMGMLRMGKRYNIDAEEKRAMNMLRMGKRLFDEEEEKRAMSMLRMGKKLFDQDRKRAMNMLRMGKRDLDLEPKRAMGMLRMGKRDLDLEPKRAMGMLRMGKREFDDIDKEKRAMGMLRMGKSEPLIEEDKRAMSMLRMGK